MNTHSNMFKEKNAVMHNYLYVCPNKLIIKKSANCIIEFTLGTLSNCHTHPGYGMLNDCLKIPITFRKYENILIEQSHHNMCGLYSQ